jgi:hypothetical protein
MLGQEKSTRYLTVVRERIGKKKDFLCFHSFKTLCYEESDMLGRLRFLNTDFEDEPHGCIPRGKGETRGRKRATMFRAIFSTTRDFHDLATEYRRMTSVVVYVSLPSSLLDGSGYGRDPKRLIGNAVRRR